MIALLAKVLNKQIPLSEIGVTGLVVIAYLFIATLASHPLNAKASGIEHISIEDDLDSTFSPYFDETFDSDTYQDDRFLAKSCLATFRSGHGEAEAGFWLTIYNQPLHQAGFPSDVSVFSFRDKSQLFEVPVNLKIFEHVVIPAQPNHETELLITGTRNDSIFIQSVTRSAVLALGVGVDGSGNGLWDGTPYLVGNCDYDYDRRTEVFVHVNPWRDAGPSRLYCVELDGPRIEWEVDLTPQVSGLVSCYDSLSPGILVVTYSPGLKIIDSLLTSHLGYLVRIDADGHIVYAKIAGLYNQLVRIISNPSDNTFYVSHSVPFTDASQALDSSEVDFRISKIDASATIIRSKILDDEAQSLWMRDWDGDRVSEVYVLTRNGKIEIFDQDLNLFAESDRSTLNNLLTRLPSWGEERDVFVFQTATSTEIYGGDFHKLAVLEPGAALVEPLQFSENGDLLAAVVSGSSKGRVIKIHRRGLFQIASAAYFKYRVYIVAAFAAAVVALFLTNYYRLKTRRNLILIAQQNQIITQSHKTLEEKSQSLAEALERETQLRDELVEQKLHESRERLVASERYKQIRDIAGGFAHEIRNALFPARGSLARLAAAVSDGKLDSDGLDRYLRMADQSLGHAISITKLITQFAKIEEHNNPVPVRLRATLDSAILLHNARICEQGVTIQISGDESVSIVSDPAQFQLVLSNLLSNSLDALTNRSKPAIFIHWLQENDAIVLTLEDNGCGISNSDCDRAFDAFFSTKPDSGSGIGLTIAKKIVEMYGGNIVLRSEQGRGTTIQIRLQSATSCDKPNYNSSLLL